MSGSRVVGLWGLGFLGLEVSRVLGLWGLGCRVLVQGSRVLGVQCFRGLGFGFGV